MKLSGFIESEPQFSHELYGEGFYEFLVVNGRFTYISPKLHLVRIFALDALVKIAYEYGEHELGRGGDGDGRGSIRRYGKITFGCDKADANFVVPCDGLLSR